MRSLPWVLCLMLAATPASTQAITGTILGAVSDQTGALLPSVSISVTNEQTGLKRSAATNASGNYSITNLPIGIYRVEAELSGFRKESRSGIELQVDQRARMNCALSVGQITEVVNVNAAAPLLQTDDAFIGAVIDDMRIRRLPLNGRQYESLAQLSPGVVTPVPGSHLSARGGFNVAGMDEHYNSFLLDGIDNVDPVVRNFSFRPSVDLIDEFKIHESGGNAEFGRNAGAVINATTKSGTNSFHGSAWEFIRNDDLDARSYFAPTGTPKPPLIRNQFGGTLGGPIEQDRTFFFAAYEGLRQKAGTARNASVPTARMRAGDLSELGGVIRDPLSGTIFTGGVIPAGRIHPIAREVIAAYPLPNLPGIRGNRAEVGSRIEDGDDVSFRLDHQLLESTRVNGRYSYSNTRVFDPFRTETTGGVNLSNFGQTVDRMKTNIVVAITTIRGRKFVNEFRAGYNRFKQPQLPVNKGTPLQERLMGFEKAFLGYIIPGFDSLGSGAEFRRAVNVYNYIENASYTAGNHQLKVGADVRRYLFNFYAVNPNTFIFAGVATGNPLADFLLGIPFTTFSSAGSPGGNSRKTETALYFQDDWKVFPRLTLNYGIRWEFYGRIKEKMNKQSLWLPECNCMKVAGNGLPEQLVDDDYNNFAPRLGFALRPFNDDRTVIRGTGGIFYDSDMRNNSEVIANPPFLRNERFLLPLIPTLSLDNPFPMNAGIPSLTPITLDRHYRDTYAANWTLGLQREVHEDVIAEISYVGNHVVKARRFRNLNQPVNRSFPYPGFSYILLFEQAGSSNFNALQARLEKRFSDGLSFSSSYTWGHAIDDRPGQSGGLPMNSYDMRSERGDADFDVRHRWTLSTVWELPVGSNRRWGRDWTGPMNAILGGWGVSGIASIHGGRPFTVVLAQDISGATVARDRPNLVPGISWKPGNQRPDHWINPAAFSTPAPGMFGNLGRNTLRGPQFHNLDLALLKNIQAGDDVLVQLRAEFFNIFNHPNFALPNATLDTTVNPALTNFGVIPATVYPERQIQFGLRIEF